MTFAILADLKARLARLRDATARPLAALRRAITQRSAAARAAATAGHDRAVVHARHPASRTRGALGPLIDGAVDRAGRVIHDPDALPGLARAYVAVLILATAAGLIGLPWPLPAPRAPAGGVARLALVAHVLATMPGRLPAPELGRPVRHRLRVAVAAGLLAMAALGFTPGRAVGSQPVVEATAPAVVASAPAGPIDRGKDRRAARDRRRVAATASLA